MLGGFHSFGPGGYGETGLAKVLPVEMEHNERQPVGRHAPRGRASERAGEDGRRRAQPRHFVMTLAAGPEANAAAWAKLPPLDGAKQVLRNRSSSPAPTCWPTPTAKPRIPCWFRKATARAASSPSAFDLALVDARLRVGPQALLAADTVLLAGAGPGQEHQGNSGSPRQHPLLSRQSRGVHRRRHRRQDEPIPDADLKVEEVSSSPTASGRPP